MPRPCRHPPVALHELFVEGHHAVVHAAVPRHPQFDRAKRAPQQLQQENVLRENEGGKEGKSEEGGGGRESELRRGGCDEA